MTENQLTEGSRLQNEISILTKKLNIVKANESSHWEIKIYGDYLLIERYLPKSFAEELKEKTIAALEAELKKKEHEFKIL